MLALQIIFEIGENGDELKCKDRNETDWSDRFGDLENSAPSTATDDDKTYPEDDDDDDGERPFVRLSKYGRANSQIWYGKEIEKLSKQNKISEAIAIVEQKMLKQDRVQPNEYVFTALIGALGRAGYTKKAFQLFNQMKKYGLTASAPTYTGLFNACANSPYQGDGITRARRLHQQMTQREIIANSTTSAAMIKCYSLCDDIEAAFKVVDEMIANRVALKVDTFNALLIGCISNKDSGLKHSMAVWSLMKKRGIRPTLQTYNLMLRTVRDCSLGDTTPGMTHLMLTSGLVTPSCEHFNTPKELKILPVSIETTPNDLTNLPITLETTPNDLKSLPVTLETTPNDLTNLPITLETTPNDLKSLPVTLETTPNDLTNLPVSIENTPKGRLQLLGGVGGFYEAMSRDSVAPSIITDTLMLAMIENDEQAELDHLRHLQENRRSVDVGFMNQLIRRRCLRSDLASAKIILRLMGELNISIDMHTYGCLAMGCKQKTDGLALLDDIENENLVASDEFYVILLKQTRMNFSYKKALCQRMRRQNAVPSVKFIELCEKSIQRAQHLISSSEQNKLRNSNDFSATPRWVMTFKEFARFYTPWLKSLPSVNNSKDLWKDFK